MEERVGVLETNWIHLIEKPPKALYLLLLLLLLLQIRKKIGVDPLRSSPPHELN